MTNINAVLNQRIKKSENTSKMAAMAKQSARGDLTSFSGVFSVTELSLKEKESLETLLQNHSNGNENLKEDFKQLLSITSEVKAINNQAAILHGERIKKAHAILIRYREGAFTAWLLAAYGNRQTPYNLMQYYEFYEAMPKVLRPQIELMPRQAVYVLASRQGPIDKKRELVEDYKGESKNEMLNKIRQIFPLQATDKRRKKIYGNTLTILNQLFVTLKNHKKELSSTQQDSILKLLKQMQRCLEK